MGTVKDTVSQSLANVLRPLVDVHPGERLKTFLMFFYFFFTIALIYIVKPIRNSLFLGELGAQNLRYVYMGEGIFLILVVSAYVYFAKRIPKQIFLPSVLAFFMIHLVCFWFLFRLQIPYLSAFFYVWVASFSITMTTQFWILANDIFNPIEAKRLFGLIISGGSLGGIFGGILTQQAVRWVKTEDLLFVAAGILSVCILLTMTLWKVIPSTATSERHPPAGEKIGAESKGGDKQDSLAKLFKGSSYLLMLASLVIIAKVSSTIVDNQFNRVVELSIVGTEARTGFFGGFMAGLNALSFFMQLVMTGIFLKYLGVGFSLWILPAGLFFFSGVSFVYPVLLTGLCFKLFDGSVNYSIQQASREVLYLPLLSSLRYRVKPVIDMLGFRLAKTLGGVFIAISAPLFGLADERLGVLVLILLPFWGVVVWRMRNEYSQLLRERLVNREDYAKATETRHATDVLSMLHQEKDFEAVKHFMHHQSSIARKLAATSCFAYVLSSRSLKSVRRIIGRMAEEEALELGHETESTSQLNDRDAAFLKKFVFSDNAQTISDRHSAEAILKHDPDTVLFKLSALLQDTNGGLANKRRAVRILEFIPHQESMDLLLHTIATSKDHAFRFVMLKALNRLHDRNQKLAVNRFLVKNEILRDIKICQRIQRVRYFYDDRKKKSRENYLGVALKAIEDESLERIFQYLDLLYPHEAIEAIYDGIVADPEKSPMRAHARELLDHTLERDLLNPIQRLLDKRDYAPAAFEEIVKILKSFTRSRDRWFSLLGFFFLSETGIDERWPELLRLQEEMELKIF